MSQDFSFKKPGFFKSLESFESTFTLPSKSPLKPSLLPIHKHKNEILYLLQSNQVLIIIGQTGCGKTTQLPQILLEAGWASDSQNTATVASLICCTQPRRIAALSVSNRVSSERNESLGTSVGYAVRFEEVVSSSTQVLYMTDGLLFREALLDPLFLRYSVIIIDEAHERSLYSDLLVGLLKKVLSRRSDLRVIVCSATLDARVFLEFFKSGSKSSSLKNPTTNNSNTWTVAALELKGTLFPVDIYYLNQPCVNLMQGILQQILQIHRSNDGKPGDILVFLTGREEIERLSEWLYEELQAQNQGFSSLLILPLYSGLSLDEQKKVLEPSPSTKTRKVILATNLAETSITIDGIVYVIDCGLVKVKIWDPTTQLEKLKVVRCSKASAIQRAGRAGRLGPGQVFRMYTQACFSKDFLTNNVPEIQRTNWVSIVLQLKALGIDNLLNFELVSPPPLELLESALEHLFALDVLDSEARLTKPLGEMLCEFPLDPMLSKALVCSHELGCSREMLTIAAILNGPDIFIVSANNYKDLEEIKRKFSVEEGDHLSLFNVYHSFQTSSNPSRFCAKNSLNFNSLQKIRLIEGQLVQYMKKFKLFPLKSCLGPSKNLGAGSESLTKAIASGYFENVATLNPDGSYQSFKNKNLSFFIHPHSVLFRKAPEWLLYTSVTETTKVFIKDVTVVTPSLLSQVAPNYYSWSSPSLKI